ncbi:uncharacterized protein LOC134846212 [Symsagittifera roscoffensis]|uniref:uncharacterized protein LOC134846212 n=1 Tax=Symsagittifera roscoffensis TaxID=84072 RepID=UPI00307B1930
MTRLSWVAFFYLLPVILIGHPASGIHEPDFHFNEHKCYCVRHKCACCVSIKEDTYNLDEKICVSVAYLSKDVGVKADFEITHVFNISKEVSLRNPPALCPSPVVLPFLKQMEKHEIEFCIHFRELQFSKDMVEGCVEFELQFLKFLSFRVQLLCFELWVAEASQSCNQAFDGVELCPEKGNRTSKALIHNHVEDGIENVKSRERRETGIEKMLKESKFCSKACISLKNRVLQIFKIGSVMKPEVAVIAIFIGFVFVVVSADLVAGTPTI